MRANLFQRVDSSAQPSFVLQKVLAQIEQDLDSKLKFKSFHSSGFPLSIKASFNYYYTSKSCFVRDMICVLCIIIVFLFLQANSCSVKLNNAAILRREALNNRQVEEELQR